MAYKEITYQDVVYLTTTSCPSCGCMFGMERDSFEECKKTGNWFFCPNGHSMSFGSRIAELEKKLSEKERLLTISRCETTAERNKREVAEKTLATHQKRTKNGVCPCCHRSFQDLRRHIATKHPKFSEK